jgi:hypothetical protein
MWFSAQFHLSGLRVYRDSKKKTGLSEAAAAALVLLLGAACEFPGEVQQKRPSEIGTRASSLVHLKG